MKKKMQNKKKIHLPIGVDEITYLYVHKFKPIFEGIPSKPYGHLKEGEVYIAFKKDGITYDEEWAVDFSGVDRVPQPYWIFESLVGDDGSYEYDLQELRDPDFNFTVLSKDQLDKLYIYTTAYKTYDKTDTDMKKDGMEKEILEKLREEIRNTVIAQMKQDGLGEAEMKEVLERFDEISPEEEELLGIDPEDDGSVHYTLEDHEADQVSAVVDSFLSIPSGERMRDIIVKTIVYIAQTFEEKYEDSKDHDAGAYTKEAFMLSKTHGKGANCGNASKYIQRYCTEGYDKSDNPNDVLKAIHYLMIELERRDKHNI